SYSHNMTRYQCLLFSFVFGHTDITVRCGQDVTLHCQDPRGVNITLLEWSIPEIKSDGYVFFYRIRHSYESYQHERFKGRVELSDPSMKNGDVSVILKNVNVNDTGTYECRIITSNLSSGQRVQSDFLMSTTQTVSSHSVQKNITAGQNVTLPCRAPNNNKTITMVEWSRPDLGSEYVLFYRNKQFAPDNQHPSFKNRVDLQDRQMKDGDVSLILKNVTINDTGTYECHCKTFSGTLEAKCIKEVEVGEDATLDCQGPHEGNILRVAWTKSDLKADDYVCFFREDRLYKTYQHESFKGRVELEDPNMKSGKMSIILHNVTVNDTGTYECHISYETDHSQRSEMKQETKLKVTPAGELKPRVCPL
uniref:Ig-like domain-containing protein n=1 Tax=Astatotilapia calliptera TaxID=8154 RepID=A0A3P8QRC0_ASTCA